MKHRIGTAIGEIGRVILIRVGKHIIGMKTGDLHDTLQIRLLQQLIQHGEKVVVVQEIGKTVGANEKPGLLHLRPGAEKVIQGDEQVPVDRLLFNSR